MVPIKASFYVLATLLLATTLSVTEAGKARKRGASAYSEWTFAHGTFYGQRNGSETTSGACGFRDTTKTGYGTLTAAASSEIWKRGYACGACLEVVCLETATWRYCRDDGPSSVTITITNMCPQNPDLPSNRGGWCNNPRKHLDMTMDAYLTVAIYQGGIVPIKYRRIPCIKKGGLVFDMRGNHWWFEMNVQNVAGPGDIHSIFFKTYYNGWTQLKKNWGMVFTKNGKYRGNHMSFLMRSILTDDYLLIEDGLPSRWVNGRSYQVKENFPTYSMRTRNLMESRKIGRVRPNNAKLQIPEKYHEELARDLPSHFSFDSVTGEFRAIEDSPSGPEGTDVRGQVKASAKSGEGVKNSEGAADSHPKRAYPTPEEMDSWSKEFDREHEP